MGRRLKSVTALCGIPKIKLPAGQEIHHCHYTPGARKNNPGFFYKGNQFAISESNTEDANLRRRQGLLKSRAIYAQRKRERGAKRVLSGAEMKARGRHMQRKRKIYRELREIQTIARENAEAAMKMLGEMVSDKTAPENARIAAASVILDRAYGKATQVNINDTMNRTGKPNEVDGAELENRINQAIERVEAATGGKKQKKKGAGGPPDLRVSDRDPNDPKQRLN